MKNGTALEHIVKANVLPLFDVALLIWCSHTYMSTERVLASAKGHAGIETGPGTRDRSEARGRVHRKLEGRIHGLEETAAPAVVSSYGDGEGKGGGGGGGGKRRGHEQWQGQGPLSHHCSIDLAAPDLYI